MSLLYMQRFSFSQSDPGLARHIWFGNTKKATVKVLNWMHPKTKALY